MLSILILLTLALVPQAAAKPNVLFIMVDDLDFGDLSSHGATDLRTPHIDQLMAAGVRFNNSYANCPVCSPTRASFLTGRYPDMVGVPGVIRTYRKDSWGQLDTSAPTILRVGATDLVGTNYTARFKGEPGVANWKVKGGTDLSSFPDNLTAASTITESKPGCFLMSVPIIGAAEGAYLLRAEHRIDRCAEAFSGASWR